MNREGLDHYRRIEEEKFLNAKSIRELQIILERETGKETPSRNFFSDRTYKQELIKVILDSKFPSE